MPSPSPGADPAAARPCSVCGSVLRIEDSQGSCAVCLMRLVEGPAKGNSAADTPTTKTASAPDWFGDYELLQQIGRGGMGVVYEARQTGLNRVVALKMILGGDRASAAAIRRFRVEAEAAARLSHPNIVTIYEFGELDSLPYFSMQRIEGTSLDRRVGELTVRASDQAVSRTSARSALMRIAKLIATLARALDYAHRLGVVHCDVKPSNILIDGAGEPHLTDFGIAHCLDREGMLTRSDVIGTPRYMSPEQAVGRRGDITAATDIYALGVVLHELLTARPPFAASTPAETLRQVIEQEPAAPHESNPMVPRELSIICLKCLEKNPSHRYASAAELADDLDRWQRREPIQARRTSWLKRAIRWGQRQPAIAGLAVSVAFLLVAVAVGSALFAWQVAEKEKQRQTAANLLSAGTLRMLGEFWENPDKTWTTVDARTRRVLLGGSPPMTFPGPEVTLTFGVYTFENPIAMFTNFAPLLSAVEKSVAARLRRSVRLDCRIYRSYTNGHAALLAGDVDFMRAGPASYVQMKDKQPGISLLAAQDILIDCKIFTRIGSGITNLHDLRGKDFAFGDRESTFGSVLTKIALANLGIAARDLGRNSRHVNSHDTVFREVMSGRYAAGAANSVVFRNDPRVVVLHTFTNVLYMPFVARAGLDPAVEQALREALLGEHSPAVLASIAPKLKGFREARDEDYRSLWGEMKKAAHFGDVDH